MGRTNNLCPHQVNHFSTVLKYEWSRCLGPSWLLSPIPLAPHSCSAGSPLQVLRYPSPRRPWRSPLRPSPSPLGCQPLDLEACGFLWCLVPRSGQASPSSVRKLAPAPAPGPAWGHLSPEPAADLLSQRVGSIPTPTGQHHPAGGLSGFG